MTKLVCRIQRWSEETIKYIFMGKNNIGSIVDCNYIACIALFYLSIFSMLFMSWWVIPIRIIMENLYVKEEK